jgi:hypothetical protein
MICFIRVQNPFCVELLCAICVLLQAGFLHSCGILADGRLFCWGNNLHNETGSDKLMEPDGLTCSSPAGCGERERVRGEGKGVGRGKGCGERERVWEEGKGVGRGEGCGEKRRGWDALDHSSRVHM